MVGLVWGRAVSRTIEYLKIEFFSHISVVILTGVVLYYLHNRRQKKGGLKKFQDIHVIPAPLLASTEEMTGKFLSELSIKDIPEVAKSTI
ncbi:hypothetical protein ACFVRR_15925 [Gottfriedia sp. NPDC057948]|uniref:hypothetical protein n=1 Tax=Gottfriedia sp. NPDC057948 TaxID=3346287 RepID=UPI0036D8847B